MEAKELRLGNIVRIKESIVVLVTGISNNGIVNYEAPKSKSDINVSELEPLPLSGEFLINAGFIRGELDRSQFIKGSITVTRDDEQKCFISNWPAIEVRYVHQLQNLNFALNGDELEIKL